ncbi:MAG: endonuclease/exonuclease/phosphatase family protein [Verrucomicrobia bacterium]|nr:endonuclease/exonuclease/phosphatase family protein [Verrucomicrobiota bacterium]MDA1067024.1 endonuclease/exonuclease/phosphatase family protein [Verrucomicrobiota bacterium]
MNSKVSTLITPPIKFFLAIALAQSFFFSHSLIAQDDLNPVIKVMSFNIRYGTAKDGDNSWAFRQDLVVETIQTFDPDLLGLQEVQKFQVDYLKEQLPDYDFYGVGRDDGLDKGEFAPVMFKKDRFEVVQSGHFWLSETPEVVGSKSWDAALPRIATWVLLRDKEAKSLQIIFGNTHFDHKGDKARLESAKLIRSRIDKVVPDLPVIVTGDFNTHDELEPYEALVSSIGKSGATLIDTYRVIHPEKGDFEGTFGGFKGNQNGNRIDWVITTQDVMTLNATINHTNNDGRYPSDHYPVEAVVRIRKSSSFQTKN